MRSLPSLINLAGRTLAHHLGRLCRAPGGLMRRVRDAVLESLKEEGIAAPPRRGGDADYCPGRPSREHENLPPPQPAPGRDTGPRWARALAAVLGAAARWLLRPPGRYLGLP
jgi:hypothetical protein